MKFSLTNIGKIAQADIEISGLTVLGGYNDIGKSTIGKMIFSVVKTMSDIEQEIREAITEQVEQELADFSVKIRKITGSRKSIMSIGGMEGTSERFYMRLFERIDRLRRGLQFSLRDQQDIEGDVSNYLARMREELQSDGFDTVSAGENIEVINEVKNLLDSLENSIRKTCSPEKTESYKKVFNSINKSLFRGDIQNRNVSTTESEISSEDGSCKIDASFENGNAKSFVINGDFPFKDVTLVDSPLVLGWSSSVGVSRSRVRNIFGHYIFDLLNKIRFSTPDSYNAVSDNQRKSVDKISSVIGGQMYYDREQRDFVFKQGDIIVQPVNIASGIKTFGIIQMLLTGGIITSNTVLIIDEPEAHLHPEWQLKYAEVLTQLVDMGVYVLVSTHSPYMIEALKHYSEKLQQEKITNFYLGNAGEHGTVFSDVTQNLDALFELLAKPMRRLM